MPRWPRAAAALVAGLPMFCERNRGMALHCCPLHSCASHQGLQHATTAADCAAEMTSIVTASAKFATFSTCHPTRRTQPQ